MYSYHVRNTVSLTWLQTAQKLFTKFIGGYNVMIFMYKCLELYIWLIICIYYQEYINRIFKITFTANLILINKTEWWVKPWSNCRIIWPAESWALRAPTLLSVFIALRIFFFISLLHLTDFNHRIINIVFCSYHSERNIFNKTVFFKSIIIQSPK